MENINETQVMVEGIDSVTGLEHWESTLGNLKKWELTDDEIDVILKGGKVKCVSPNGRRVIFISKK